MGMPSAYWPGLSWGTRPTQLGVTASLFGIGCVSLVRFSAAAVAVGMLAPQSCRVTVIRVTPPVGTWRIDANDCNGTATTCYWRARPRFLPTNDYNRSALEQDPNRPTNGGLRTSSQILRFP